MRRRIVRSVRILIIEDERNDADALARGFRGEGHDALVPPSGEDGCFGATPEIYYV